MGCGREASDMTPLITFPVYYLSVALFTSGMMFGIVLTERHKPDWRDWVSVVLSGVLWPLVVLYVILQDKYDRRG